MDRLDPLWIRVLPVRLRRRLMGRHAVHAMLANSGWLLADRLLRMFLALVVGAWVARHLGPGRYGVLAYAIALLAFVTPLAMLGLEAIVVRNGAQDHAKSTRILGTALFLITASWLAECVGPARLTQMTGHHR